MALVRGSALASYPELVIELGADPARLLESAGIDCSAVGEHDTFIGFVPVMCAIERAAAATSRRDFGRLLAERQGIGIFGPVGVAARTAPTVAEALAIFSAFIGAYSPVISVTTLPAPSATARFLEVQINVDDRHSHPQTTEASLGVALQVLRFLLGSRFAPLSVHLPHGPLTARGQYRAYFGCATHFEAPTAGFTLRAADLSRSLQHDKYAHAALVEYLRSITTGPGGFCDQVRTMVRQLLPTRTVTLNVVAAQFNLHPKALQRRLALAGTSFASLVDDVRRQSAERYLRSTTMTLSHLTQELGYAEQSVLTRSCNRWFGQAPLAFRAASTKGS